MVDLPPEEQEQESSGSGLGVRLIPWLLMLGLALLILPLYLGSSSIEESTAPLATEAINLQATITAPPPVPPQEQTLTTQLLDLRRQLNALGGIPATMVAGHMDWPSNMTALHSYDANRIRLIGFNNTTSQLIINGEALEESAVLEYSRALEATGAFAKIQVQNITVNPVRLPTPNLQATPDPVPTLAPIYMPFLFTLSVDLKPPGEVSNGPG